MKLRFAIGVAVVLALPLAAAAQDTAPAPGSISRASAPDIDIADLIGRYAKRTGKQIIIDPRVRAQVPLAGMDPNKIIVPDVNARQLPTPVYTDRNFKTAAPDEIVTLVLPVKNVCSAHIVPVLRPLMPQAAHMAAYPDINTLILSDHASNLHRIVTVLEALERNAPNGKGCENWDAAKK
jgi:type II secretory pathway component GspD/PulD (secretin)